MKAPGSGRASRAAASAPDASAGPPAAPARPERNAADQPSAEPPAEPSRSPRPAPASPSLPPQSPPAGAQPAGAQPSRPAERSHDRAEAPARKAPAPGPAQSADAAPSAFDIAEVRRQWRSVVDVIKRSSRATAALVETATPVTVRGDTLVITVPPALVRRLADPHQHQPLKAALVDVLGVSWSVEVTDAAQTQGGPSSRLAEPPPDDDEYFAPDPDDESVTDPRASLDPGQAAVNLLRDELGAEEIVEQ